jgi:hypothetical protein
MITMNVATWSDFKTLVAAKKILMQYTDDGGKYHVFAIEHPGIAWAIRLLKDGSADVEDFEDNFKTNANKPLEVRSSSVRPPRVTASPQPDGTTETWKGFEIEFGTEDTEKSVYVTFDTIIYLRGGYMLADNVLDGDVLNATVEAFNGSTWNEVSHPMIDVPLSTKGKIEVVSPECLDFPTYLRLKVTITSQAGSARKYRGYLDYYK